MEEISLRIRDKVFKIEKSVLCEYSDYFRAMFSGNYVENKQEEICIDMLDPNVMEIIIQYMKIGLIHLSEYPLATIGDMAVAANFLQIVELIKQIEYTLDIQLCESNWIETKAIAEMSCFSKLEQFCVAYGLFSFKSMLPKYISTINQLAWYLAHPYLDAQNEYNVFKFGFEWVTHAKIEADAILTILSCLDVKRLTCNDLKKIKKYMETFENSLASKVVDCLYDICYHSPDITESFLNEHKTHLCQKFTAAVWNETLSIVKQSKARCLKITPIVPMWILKDAKPELLPQCLYTYNEEKGFDQWLKVAEKNLWGWSFAAWGLTKLVIVNGEYGRGTGRFIKDVNVYDTLREEWICHSVGLPSIRHAGITVVGDLLYIIGGVGGFRVVLDTAVVYDLKNRSHRYIARLPDAIQSPAVCSHENRVYFAGQKHIYRYEDTGEQDSWSNVVTTNMRMSCIKPIKEHIYCIQNYFRNLYRFKPDFDEKLQLITYFSSLPATICSLNDKLLVFTWTACEQSDMVSVEEFRDDLEKPTVVFAKSKTMLKVNDVAGSHSLVLSLPPMCLELSDYQNKHLRRYANKNQE